MPMSGSDIFAVGEIRIERLVEMEFPFLTPMEAYLDAAADAVEALRERFEPWALCPTSGKMILAVQSYLVRTSRHTVLIDTCVGCDKSNSFLPAWHMRTDRAWLEALAAAGVAPEAIDFVFCTHLHSDHCGWHTRRVDGEWVPTFPNARYVFARSEIAHFEANPNDAYRESVLPVIAAGQAELVDTDYALDDEIWLEPTPGHTPGHVAVRLASRGEEAVMCGDLMHSPLQCAHPEWRYRIDWDPILANATRRSFLESVCERDRLVLTAHFPSPSVGRVVADGEAFDFRYL